MPVRRPDDITRLEVSLNKKMNPSSKCNIHRRNIPSFEQQFHEPIGRIESFAGMVEEAYIYFYALRRESTTLPNNFCIDTSHTKTACPRCAAQHLAAMYSSSQVPEKNLISEFIKSLVHDKGNKAEIVKGAVMATIIKLVCDVIRYSHNRCVEEHSGGLDEIRIPGKNSYLRPVRELACDHIGENATLVFASGLSIAHDKRELWAASVRWLQWAADYKGDDEYGYSDWQAAAKFAEIPGRESSCEAQ
jgi:hypothetical protein